MLWNTFICLAALWRCIKKVSEFFGRSIWSSVVIEEQWKSSLSFFPGETYWTRSLLRFSMIIMVKISSSWLYFSLSSCQLYPHRDNLTQYPLIRSQSSTLFLTKFDFTKKNKKKLLWCGEAAVWHGYTGPNWCLWYTQLKKRKETQVAPDGYICKWDVRGWG